MKKILFIIPAVIAATAFFGCDNDKTELSFTNSHNSDYSINEILWEQDGVKWSQTDGWAPDATTNAQDVSSTTSIVRGSAYFGGNWNEIEIFREESDGSKTKNFEKY